MSDAIHIELDALCLGAGLLLGCMWYQYVLDALG